MYNQSPHYSFESVLNTEPPSRVMVAARQWGERRGDTSIDITSCFGGEEHTGSCDVAFLANSSKGDTRFNHLTKLLSTHRKKECTLSRVSFIILLSKGPQAIVFTLIPCFPSLTANT